MSKQLTMRTAAFAIPLLLLNSHPPSGVSLTKQSLAKQMVFVKNQADAINPISAVTEQPNATFEQLEQIKSIFALKISEMSEIFSTSRPTIYAWLNGSSPKDSASLDKISYVAKVAQRFAALSFTKPEAVLKRPVLVDNRTLLQCLMGNIDISDKELKMLHQIDQREATKRAEPKLTRKRHNDIDLLTTPIINDLV